MKIFDKVNNNKFYKKIFKSSYPYFIGAILLSILQILSLAITQSPWGVSAILANWGAWIYEALGGNVDKWYYFKVHSVGKTLKDGFLNSPESMRNIGIILGALLATLGASQFRVKKIKGRKQALGAALGGLMMGYGSRIAFGCNIGALYSGISSLSLSGWVFGLFMFIGAIVGSKLLIKYLI